MVRGGRGKKGCLSQRHAHITNTKTITGTAPGVPGRSCALPASRGASHSKYCTALPVLSPSFLATSIASLPFAHLLFATRHARSIHQQAALHTKAAPRHQKEAMGVVVSPALSPPAAALTPVPWLPALNSSALLRSP